MGIQNLLQELKPITKYAKLSEFNGQTCGVDASCWLHRASYSCALQLISGKSTKKYLRFTLNCINLLKYFNITPIIVFDGAHLPMKANEERRRNDLRDKNKREALQQLKSGNTENAWKAAQKAVHITKQMVTGFMNQCIEEHVQFVCAPYEADSQLGYMYKQRQIDFVLTEDSDLLLFGVQKALYKFNPKTTSGQFVNLNMIREYKPPVAKKRKMDLCSFLKRHWLAKDTDDETKRAAKQMEFIHVCVLSGCDYVHSLPGIGLKTAVKHCTEYRRMEHLLSTLMNNKRQAPKDYLIQFKRAVLTFRHQTVYDIESKKQTHLNPLTESVDLYLNELRRYTKRSRNNTNAGGSNSPVYDTTLEFLGKMAADDETARAIAEGRVNARSLKPRRLVQITQGISSEEEAHAHADGDGNRFAKRLSTENTSINVFSQVMNAKDGSMRKGVVHRSNVNTKVSKYFGKRNDEKVTAVNLDELLTQFDMFEYKVPQTEDTMNIERKEEMDACEANVNYNEHKPLRRPRKNRKRKRCENELECDGIPLQNINNIKNTNNAVQKVSRRRLNHSNTPRHIPQKAMHIKTPIQSKGWMSDLWNASSSKRNHKSKSRVNGHENKENIGEKRGNINPFSVKRKSLALIGAEHKPMDCSESESESEEEEQVHSNNMDCVHRDIYDCLDAEEEDEEDTMADGMYSQLSQSQSERQVHDIGDRFHISQSQASVECKRDQDEADEEDDDIEIISKREEIEKKTTPKCMKAKPFKTPRFKNGEPPVIRNRNDAKKKVNVKSAGNGIKNKMSANKSKSKAKKRKNVNCGNQRSITSFFKRK